MNTQVEFERQFLPVVEKSARGTFPDWGHDPEEHRAEAVATAWSMFSSAATRDQARTKATPNTIARFACDAVRSGRRFSGTSCRCVMSSVTQIKGRSKIAHLHGEPRSGLSLIDTFACKRTPNPADVARVRIDFAILESKLNEKQQQVLHMLAIGANATEIAKALQISNPRVTQIRYEICDHLRTMGYAPPA